MIVTETRPVSAEELASTISTRSNTTTAEPTAKRRRVWEPKLSESAAVTSSASTAAEQVISDAASVPAMPSCHSKDDAEITDTTETSVPNVPVAKRKHSLLPSKVPSGDLPGTPAARIMPSRNTRNSNPDYGAAKSKKSKTEAADKYVSCELCGEWTCDGVSDRMLICDGCNKYYHKKCWELSHMPGEQWLCDDCIQKGLRLEVMVDHEWRAGKVTSVSGRDSQGNSLGIDVLFDDGCRDQIDLSVEKWRPQCLNPLHEAAAVSDELLDAVRLTRYIPTIIEPKTYNSVKHLSAEEQRKWHESMHAEWTSLKKKGVFVLVKRREIDPTATLIPTKWVFKIKSCGRYKSRLCALGNLMAEDKSIDHESPTPSLPVVRLMHACSAWLRSVVIM